jgi:type II secretory pathway pseudopilin PulG
MLTRRLVRAARARLARVRAAREDGFSTLEAVVVIPVVVILTMLVIQFVMLWHARNITEAAAQNALRVARGYQAAAAQGQESANEYLSKVAAKMLDNYTVDVQRGPDTVTVTVHATVSRVVPFGTYTVTERASGPVEKFATG